MHKVYYKKAGKGTPKGYRTDLNMKLKKTGILIIAGLVLSICSGKLLFDTQAYEHNELNIAILGVFQTILPGDKEVKHQNPYFYSQNTFNLSAEATYYSTVSYDAKEKVNIEGKLIKNYKTGDLFKLKIDFREDQGLIYDNTFKAPIQLTSDRVVFYFYVTNEKIYLVNPYIYNEQKKQVYIGLNNEMALTFFLPTDQKIIANSEIVCQEEILHVVDEYGGVTNITSKNEEVEYGRREYNQSNGELSFHEDFIWEKDKGLIFYGSAYRMEAEILYLNAIEEIE